MRDYEYLFATTLHEKLKEKIVGGIFVNVTPDDVLHITIKNGDVIYILQNSMNLLIKSVTVGLQITQHMR